MTGNGRAYAAAFVKAVTCRLAAAAEPARAASQRAYMRDQWEFLGVAAPGVKEATKETLKEMGEPWRARGGAIVAPGHPTRIVGEEEVTAVLQALWKQPQREFRHVGIALSNAFASSVRAGVKAQRKSKVSLEKKLPFPQLFFDAVRDCITTEVCSQFF